MIYRDRALSRLLSLLCVAGAVSASAPFVSAQGRPPINWMRGAFSNVQTLAYSPNGAMLAEGSPQSGEIRIFNASTGVLLFTLSSGVPQSIYSVAFSHDGKLLAAGGYTSKGLGDVELWNVADGSLKAV